jgi:hypothetical protein
MAEDYGIADAAARMYKRAEKLKFEQPDSTYSLAQRHLQALNDAPAAPKAAGH